MFTGFSDFLAVFQVSFGAHQDDDVWFFHGMSSLLFKCTSCAQITYYPGFDRVRTWHEHFPSQHLIDGNISLAGSGPQVRGHVRDFAVAAIAFLGKGDADEFLVEVFRLLPRPKRAE